MSRTKYFESIQHDLKYAIRTMRKNLAFSVAVVLTIALGIGANTAMFSVIRAVLLKPLDYQEPERVVVMTNGATPVRFEEMTAASRSYSELGAFTGFEDVALSGAGEPQVLKGVRVSGNFLSILGVSPLQGRSFLRQEDKPGAPPVAMISAELWRRAFGKESAIVGKTATLAGVPTTIIGVLPPAFQFPVAGADVWLTKPEEWSALQAKSRPAEPVPEHVWTFETTRRSCASQCGTRRCESPICHGPPGNARCQDGRPGNCAALQRRASF